MPSVRPRLSLAGAVLGPAAILAVLLASTPLRAEHPLPGPHIFTCEARGDTVHLEWDVLGVDPTVNAGAFLERDGEVIAQLAAGDLSYDDPGVAPGVHVYRLVIPLAGLVIASSCTVEVAGESGVTCTVAGNVVTVAWVLTEGAFALGFLVARDGAVVATLPADARTYTEEAPSGEHVYTVSTNNRLGAPAGVGAPPDFLIGSCTVHVEGGFGIECAVMDTVVAIRWEFPLDIALAAFVVRRDGGTVAVLDPRVFSYSEDAPPGGHGYSVAGVMASSDPNSPGNEIFVGSCRVEVGGGLEPPRSLECAIAESFPVQVQLFWVNPVRYDRIIVTRDRLQIATLAGEATHFSEFDPGPGVHVYGVSGVLGGVVSPAAVCTVDLGPPGPGNRLLLAGSAGSGGDPNQAGGLVDPQIGVPPDGGSSLAAVLSNVDPVQAWSFGVCSDPAVLEVRSTRLGAGAAALNGGAGPSFLVVGSEDGGVTMAAVVDEKDPADVLAPGGTHELLVITYGPGPDARPGDAHVVPFCDALGKPPVSVVLVVGGQDVRPETIPGTVSFPAFLYLRADANNDGVVGMSDGIYILDWLFRGGPRPPCVETSDVNGSRETNIADPVYLFQNLFIGGPRPPAPYPSCGGATVFLGCDASACNV
jgi:hypothetical protein